MEPNAADSRRWRLIARLTEVINSAEFGYAHIAETAATLVGEAIGDECAVILLDVVRGDGFHWGHFHVDPEVARAAERVLADVGSDGMREWVESFGIDSRAAQRRITVTGQVPRFAVLLREHGVRRGVADIAFAPILAADGTGRGVVVIGRDRDSKTYEPSDLRALESAAETIALGLTLLASRAAERLSNRRWATGFEVSPIGMAAFGLDGRVFAANAAVCAIAGRTRDEILGSQIGSLMTPVSGDYLERDIAAALDGNPAGNRLHRVIRADGMERWVVGAVTLVRNEHGEPDMFQVQVMDVTERREAELRAEAAQHDAADLAEQRRVLLAELLVAEQTERARIAADVHDDALQLLAAAQLRVHLMLQHLDSGDTASAHEAGDLIGRFVSEAQRQLRYLLLDLEAPETPHRTIRDALRDTAEAFFSGTSTTATVSGTFTDVPPDVAAVFHRAGREAMSNARRHAGASHVVATLFEDEASWQLTVDDDGIGVPEVIPERPGHLGVRAMRSRAAGLGGVFTIGPRSEGGTRVQLSVLRCSEHPRLLTPRLL